MYPSALDPQEWTFRIEYISFLAVFDKPTQRGFPAKFYGWQPNPTTNCFAVTVYSEFVYHQNFSVHNTPIILKGCL